MAVKKRGLGRGLDAMIQNKLESEEEKPQKSASKSAKSKTSSKTKKEKETSEDKSNPIGAVMVSISKVEPNREQPRKIFDEEELSNLADSIARFGVLQPLLVQQREDYYEIIAGERRWRASKKAGLKEIPVIIRDYTDQESVEISLIENIQRKDLNAIEEACAYKQLLDDFNLRQEDVAERVSKSRTYITNSMRLLKLDDRVQTMLIEGKISSGHARTILGLEDKNEQFDVANRIIDKGLSVREVEKLVKKLAGRTEEEKKAEEEKNKKLAELDFIYRDMEDKLKNVLGTKVSIANGDGKGKIVIEYYSDDDFERLVEILSKGSAGQR